MTDFFFKKKKKIIKPVEASVTGYEGSESSNYEKFLKNHFGIALVRATFGDELIQRSPGLIPDLWACQGKPGSCQEFSAVLDVSNV